MKARIRRASLVALLLALAPVAVGCGGREADVKSALPPAKHFNEPVFDGLTLGMTRVEAAQAHPIRPSLTASGRNFLVWVYDRPGDYTVHLSFSDRGERARLRRIDVHYGKSPESADEFIGQFEKIYGAPDVRRRQPDINAYGDPTHRQFETIWSDADQYVFLTERVPLPGHAGKPVYYVTIRRKELSTAGPPTGYVPPPPPLDENGKPIEEPAF